MSTNDPHRPRNRTPFIEQVGDDHPDQPRFDGGVIGVVIVAFILWAIAGGLIWWALS